MEDKTDTHVYEMEVKPKKPEEVTIEVKHVPIESEPLFDLDTSKNFLLEPGKEVIQKLRGFALKPDKPCVDDTFTTKNPFEGPIKRTQIPIYPEEMERMRPKEAKEGETLNPANTVDQKFNELMQNLPDIENAKQMVQENCQKVIDWTREKVSSSYDKAKDFIEHVKSDESEEEKKETKKP